MKDIIIIGAGSFGKETAWLIDDINRIEKKYRILGYLDDAESLIGQTVNDYRVLGSIDYLSKLNQNYDISCVIAIQDTKIRKTIVEKLNWFNSWETLIHPSAIVSNNSKIGDGSIITAQNTISVNVIIGNHGLINIGCTIGHDCIIGNYVSIMSNSTLGGKVEIKDGSYLGTSVSIVPNAKIGEFSRVGIGSVVIRNVKDRTTVMGNPAKLLKV